MTGFFAVAGKHIPANILLGFVAVDVICGGMTSMSVFPNRLYWD